MYKIAYSPARVDARQIRNKLKLGNDFEIAYTLNELGDGDVFITEFDESRLDEIQELRDRGVFIYTLFNSIDEFQRAVILAKRDTPYEWSRFAEEGKKGFEVTTKGWKAYSPFFIPSINPHFKSIEEEYQLDYKGYFYFGADDAMKIKGRPPFKWITIDGIWTRDEVKEDKEYIYLFTDNLNRSSGNNIINPGSWYAKKYRQAGSDLYYPNKSQAVIRGLENAFPITTMKDQYKHQLHPTMDMHSVWSSEINDICNYILEHQEIKGIKFANKQFGNGQYSKVIAYPDLFNKLNFFLRSIGIENVTDTPTVLHETCSEDEWWMKRFKKFLFDNPSLFYELVCQAKTKPITDMFDVHGGQNKIYCEILNSFYGRSS